MKVSTHPSCEVDDSVFYRVVIQTVIKRRATIATKGKLSSKVGYKGQTINVETRFTFDIDKVFKRLEIEAFLFHAWLIFASIVLSALSIARVSDLETENIGVWVGISVPASNCSDPWDCGRIIEVLNTAII